MTDWVETKVSELGIILTGKTPQTSHQEYYGGSIPFITPSDDMSGKHILVTNKYLTEEGCASVSRYIIPKDTVCVTCIGTVGNVVISTRKSVTNQQINSIIVNTDKYDIDFVYYAMVLLGERLNFDAKFSSVVPIINKTNFSNYSSRRQQADGGFRPTDRCGYSCF